MQEFAEGSWKSSSRRVPKAVKKVHLPVKPILIVSAIIFVLVVMMVLFFILPEGDKPTQTDPVTEPSTLPITQLPTETTLLTPPVLPSTEVTEEITLATEETEPPTEATEPPTEATEPVVLPEGKPMNAADILKMQKLLEWPSMFAAVSNYSFLSPDELSLGQLLSPEILGSHIALTDLSIDEQNYLAALSEEYLYLDVYKVSKVDAIDVLQKYYGLNPNDTWENGSIVYWSATRCFYFISSDTRYRKLTVTHGVTLENGDLWIRYVDDDTGTVGTMTLKFTKINNYEFTYHILSNRNGE